MASSSKNHNTGGDNRWHLDKRFPIAIILAFLVQTSVFVGAGAWWSATIDARVTTLEETVSRTRDRGDRITRLETMVENAYRSLSRIEKKIDILIRGNQK